MGSPRTLEAIRRDAPASDRDLEALRLSPSPAYRSRASIAAVPEDEVATDVTKLFAWCDANGVDGNAAVSRSIWSAVYSWVLADAKQPAGIKAAVLAAMKDAFARLNGRPTSKLTVAQFKRRNKALEAWHAAGDPALSSACTATQSIIAGLILRTKPSPARSTA